MASLLRLRSWCSLRLDDIEFLADSLEDGEGFCKLFIGVKGSDYGAYAAFIGGDGREDDTLGEDAFLEEAVAELHGECAFTDDDGGDWRFALAGVEAKLFEASLEEGGIFPEAFDEAGITFQQVDGGYAGGDDRGWM